MTNRVEITDQAGTSGTVIVDRDQVAETIRPWFVDAPAEVLAAIDELQRALDAGGVAPTVDELSEFLGLGVFAADEEA